MKHSTSDLCDQYAAGLQIADGGFIHFGGKSAFCGQIATVSVQNDFMLIKEVLSNAGNNRVLVVDGKGFKGCALLGDMMAARAIDNGWSGIVINGCVRDAKDLADLNIGILALGTCPLRPPQAGMGDKDVAVTFASVTFRPGEYLYADLDGIVTSPDFYE